MKKEKWLSLALALTLCCGNALGESENLSNFTAEQPATSSRQVKGYLQDNLSSEIEGAYSAEIIWGDMEFAWGITGGEGQVWDAASHTLSMNTEGQQTGWYLMNPAPLSGAGPTAVGNPDHSHVLVFNHSFYAIQVAANMQDSNLEDNITPKLHIDPRWGVGLDPLKYEHTGDDTSDYYKVTLDGGTLGMPYNNGTDPEHTEKNCAVFKLELTTPNNEKPTGINTELGIADVSVNIQPLGF